VIGVVLDAYDLVNSDASPPISKAMEADVPSSTMPATSPLLNGSPFLFYAGEDGTIRVQVLVENETVWASQQGMAEIFDTSKQNISYHISNIFNELELDEKAVVKEILTTAADGKNYPIQFYNLDAIISVGYRISSARATQFRKWATAILKGFIHAVALHFMYYNFCKLHKTIRVTPAMAAGISTKIWELSDIVALIPQEEPKKRGPYKKKAAV